MTLRTPLNKWLLYAGALVITTCQAVRCGDASAHDGVHATAQPTFEITALAATLEAPVLRLAVRDIDTRDFTAARFSLEVDGRAYVPQAVGEHGLRFVSIHVGKRQRVAMTYARGVGVVDVPLPADARRVTVHLVKGYEYLPISATADVADGAAEIAVTLERWSHLDRQGWLAAEEHLHYERVDPAFDDAWLTMLAGDALDHAHFLILKGGNLPGIWAQQFAYGAQGEATDGARLIRPGEEFRDSSQGHINLLGVEKVVEPISTGGGPDWPYNSPVLHDVLLEARSLGAIAGVAHSGGSGRAPTAAADTILGSLEFFELANTHMYATDLWYRLMNCGYIVPPMAGTDLPNNPFRDAWQPFLGEVRTYAHVGEARDFEAWKAAVRRGKVFVTGGPMLSLSVDGAGLGATINLAAAGMVRMHAELASPLGLESFEIVRNGAPLPLKPVKTVEGRVARWTIEAEVPIESSCWLAARGVGPRKEALLESTSIEQRAMAHTAAIRVLVGDQPIRSPADAEWLLAQLSAVQEYYHQNGRYATDADRRHALGLLQSAIDKLEADARP